ncbi:MAG: hypothetical protein U0359_40290 [Byssovorax sp.]
MSREGRPCLSLYTLDRPALKAFSSELKALLLTDDRPGLAALLGLGAELARRLGEGPRAVDWLLRADDDPAASPLFASLRRVAKKRSLALAWTSPEPSLEGRLRHFELLREDPSIADPIDKLLDDRRLPWFLVRPGATGGWLPDDKASALGRALRPLDPSLPPEIVAFSKALRDLDGDLLAHDGL